MAASKKKNVISIKGAGEHNLRIDYLEVPKDKLVVFTGVSGSGKSSLAFDTLYAEGQRRYVESLSSYARQFLGQMEKPHFEKLSGLSPTVAIEQKAASVNPRSTVGTITEVYDYMRVLWARVGTQHCHMCGKAVEALSPQQLVDEISLLQPGAEALIMAPVVVNRKGNHADVIAQTRERGFVRVRIDKKIYRLDEPIPELRKNYKHSIDIVVDRIRVGDTDRVRLTDSVETALAESKGELLVVVGDTTAGNAADKNDEYRFSAHHHCVDCNVGFSELSPQSFSFNTPLGACSSCNGLGTRLEMDPALVIPDPSKSILEGAIAPFANQFKRTDGWNARIFESLAEAFDVDLFKPWQELSKQHRDLILFGTNKRFHVNWKRAESTYDMNMDFEGVANTLMRRFQQTTSPQMREFYTSYMSTVPCRSCEGKRLKAESRAVKVGGNSIVAVAGMSVEKACSWFDGLELEGARKVVGTEILKEISNRLGFLVNVGLSYLTLDRLGPSLSGGEAQRIRLASQLGAELTGVMYVLDEPSIGLHARDASKLLDALEGLRNLGNTVIVVEHDQETMERANHIIDFGPLAGHQGGHVVAQGTLAQIKSNKKSLTGAYLRKDKLVCPPRDPRKPRGWLSMTGASLNNLKNVSVKVPLGVLSVFAGVSGAGKSSLLSGTLLPALQKHFHGSLTHPGPYKKLTGLDQIDKVIHIDQKPIGKTPRSNPATYTKVFDEIRALMAQIPEARARGYQSGRFSFNVKGGRCEACGGAGMVKVEMHFLADVYVTCDTCKGHRYNDATLQVRYKSRNIKEILDITVDEAREIFENHPKISRILQTLQDVGMGYVHLGQPATTLSGGEAQRIKLSRELAKRGSGKTLYVLDEPTTGLHFDDVRKLMAVLQRLVDQGNSVVVIEHNMDVIKSADWLIDLGPGGGDQGGRIVACGTPSELAEDRDSVTGIHIKRALS